MSDIERFFVTDLLKATPMEEAGERFVFLEASNEELDIQGEVILAKALAAEAGYFLQYGNLDIDHVTQIGAKTGIPNYSLFEIGRPVDVHVDGSRTFVKGQIFTGEGPAAEKANQFWDSLTNISPVQRWYPSVGGAVLEKADGFDPETKTRKTIVSKVRWTNIGFSKTPVNPAVPTVATVPMNTLMKACTDGTCFNLSKALEAGYGTDSARLQGGGALRLQSLHGKPISYFDVREHLSAAVRNKQIKSPGAAAFTRYLTQNTDIDEVSAGAFVSRFMGDLKSNLSKRRKHCG